MRKLRRSSDSDWCFWDYPSIELAHKTIGIIGLGRIGRITARIAIAFGMKVLAYDEYRSDKKHDDLRYTDLDTLLASSDVVALHCPLTDKTENIIDESAIARMKHGAILINNSRGALVDENALAEALNSGKLAGAGLDTARTGTDQRRQPAARRKKLLHNPAHKLGGARMPPTARRHGD